VWFGLMARKLLYLSLLLILGNANATLAQVSTLPAGFYIEEVAPEAKFSLPVGLDFAPDGRVFVAEKVGRVFIVENGVSLPMPFINLTCQVMSRWYRGLLGIALDPDFENSGYVYLLYTYDRDGSGDYSRLDVVGRLTRYTADSTNGNVADLS